MAQTNIEKHVTSLEISKRLKALGVKQLSEFYWSGYGSSEQRIVPAGWLPSDAHLKPIPRDLDYSAFLASELAEMLPQGIYVGKGMEMGIPHCEQFQWNTSKKGTVSTFVKFDADTFPDVLGLMLCHLVENKLIIL